MMPMVVLSTSGTLVLLVFSLLLVIPHYCLIMAQLVPLYTFCSNTSNYTAGSPFDINLKRLLFQSHYFDGGDSIFSNVTEGNNPDTVYGLFLCRGDVDVAVSDCQKCIDVATDEILTQCPLSKEAIIFYDQCYIRYSNRSFFYTLEATPLFYSLSPLNITWPDKFPEILNKTFTDLITVATSNPSNHFYATSEANVSSLNQLYCMVQCTPNLAPVNCSKCLSENLSFMFTLHRSSGMRVFSPSCNIRHELYLFYQVPAEAPSANRTDEKGSRGWNVKTDTISTSVSAFLVVALLGSCIYYQRRRKKVKKEEGNGSEIDLLDWAGGKIGIESSSENLQGEMHAKSQDFPSIHLDIIRAATGHFSQENKLGEGGFGPVYKGTLPDGKEIAVKRLSKTSCQGLLELKNEVTMIARLQHRNLVRLLGCCLEGMESLLIYEYMPNKSLDAFLFDPTKGAELDWKRRLLIINGIARGLLYLHEDSRLRIIHRDLKAGNILLDHEMNPKISDFGMARIFGGNQSEANTKRVVGTYGYMALEYAMEGLFSVKSDVYSFGVLLLEIIRGKRNGGFYLSEHGHSLLTFAWKLWCEGQWLELMDPLLDQSFVAAEVRKCIHVGLLCVQEDHADRPNTSSAVVMLASDTMTLAQPTQPAFSIGRLALRPTQSANEVTLSDVSPR